MKEQDIQTKIKHYLESEGCWVKKIVSSGTSGTPDLIGCYKEYFFAVEVKKPKGSKTSALQIYNIRQIRKCGSVAFFANTLSEAKDKFQYYFTNR